MAAGADAEEPLAYEAVLQRLVGMSGPAYRLALRITCSEDDAEDVVQQVYLEALRGLRAGATGDNERAWFLGIVANTARMHLRARARRRRREANVSRAGSGPRPGGEMIRVLRGALEDLDERYRVPVTLCYEEEITQRQAATILKMPERTLSKYVSVGLEKLRRALARAGYPAAVAAVIGGLKQTAPAVPASLGTRVEALMARGAAAQVATGGGTALAAAAKGNLTMKLIAGVVLAGAVAAGVAVVSGRGGGAPLPVGVPPGADGIFRIEPYAFNLPDNNGLYIDGPRQESAMGRNGGGECDEADNLYVYGLYSQNLRCIRADGRVVTITGEHCWNNGPNAPSGPAAQLNLPSSLGGYDRVSLAIRGSPWMARVRSMSAAASASTKYGRTRTRATAGGTSASPAPGRTRAGECTRPASPVRRPRRSYGASRSTTSRTGRST